MMLRPAVRITLLLSLLILTSMACSAKVVYVKWDSPGPTFDGTSWATAHHTISAGITASAYGDQIWVAKGTYTGGFSLKSGVELLGGFAGTETSVGQRNVAANRATIDGVQEVLPVTAGSGLAPTTKIDGFLICNGYSNMAGGMRVLSTITISNNVFSGNVATYTTTGGSGGGIYVGAGSPVIVNNLIINNYAQMSGGGIFVYPSAAPIIANNVIAGNSDGISASVPGAGTKVVNNTVVANKTQGLRCSNGTGTFANNIFAWNGTGMDVYGTTGTIRNNCVYGNTTDYLYISPGPGDVQADPKIANLACCNVHLKLDSPCIGAGDNAQVLPGWVDLDGQARVQPVGGTVDIGADESDGTAPSGLPTVVRVSPTGSDSNDGSSWASAKLTIAAAVNALRATGGEMWVKAGTYTGAQTWLSGFTHLYGGFAGTETAKEERDWAANRTVISSVYFTLSHCYGPCEISGFTLSSTSISCGDARPSILNNVFTGGMSPAISCTYAASPVIAGNVFTDVLATAGAISCDGSSPQILNNTFVGNAGDAVRCVNASTPLVVNNLIAWNAAGIYSSGSTPVLRKNCVYGNGLYNYSGVSAGTGDISADPRLASVAYGNLHIQPDSPCIGIGDNTVVRSGWMDMDHQDRILPGGGTVDIGADESNGDTWTVSPITVRVSPDGNDVNDGSAWNQAKRTIQAAIDAAAAVGGEVWVRSGTYSEDLTLRQNAYVYGGFAGTETALDQRNWSANKTVLLGGAAHSISMTGGGYRAAFDGFRMTGVTILCSTNAHPRIANNVIAGGNITCSNASPTISGNIITAYNRLISCNNSRAKMINNTLVSSGTEGIYVSSSSSQVTIANNIIAYCVTGVSGGGGVPVFANNCLYGNTTNYLALTPGVGNILTDPKFAALAYGDVHIQPGSPCINAGSNTLAQGTKDIDCQSRILPAGGTVDIGADESDGTNWPSVPTIIRVATDGSDSNDGSSWSSAKQTVQAAVDAAAATGGDVWVKAGVYNGCVILRPYVYLYGGFAGTETSRGQRNWTANVTTLDGQASGSVVTVTSGDTYSRVDGFTIRNGSGTYLTTPATYNGGGIYCSGASPVIANNTITQNTVTGSGAGVYCGDRTRVINNNITGNSSSTGGSTGVFCAGYAEVTGNIISANTGASAAGIGIGYQSSVKIINNLITGNVAQNEGGGISGSGGSACVVANNVVVGNTAGTFGGGLRISGGTANIRSNIIAFNSSGVSCLAGTPVFAGNCVYGNTAYNYSGLTPDGTNISADPLFVDRLAGDYHLQATSPCIDAGSEVVASVTDKDGVYRPQDGNSDGYAICDIGAYERSFNLTGALHNQPNGSTVGFSASITASFPSQGCYYVETLDRVFGIRVNTTDMFAEGNVVTFSGTMQTDSVTGERYVEAEAWPSTISTGFSSFVKPYAITARALGGASIGLQGGITDSVHLNNIGLLVTTWGTISRNGGNVYISDGSGPAVRLVLPSGVTVNAGSIFAAVTGISSCEKISGVTYPVLKVRKQADIIQN